MKDAFEIKIEHGVPLKGFYNSQLSNAMRKMKVGDSFLFPEELRNNPPSTARRLGMKVSIRKTGDGMVRVWRIK